MEKTKKVRHRRPLRAGKNSTFGERTAVKTHGLFTRLFSISKPTASILAAVVVIALAIIGGLLWLHKNYYSPQRTFWAMVDNNLTTYSVTKDIHQQGTGGGNNEFTQLIFSGEPRVRDVREVATTNKGQVRIESIGTPTDTYQHYLSIRQPGSGGPAKYKNVYPLWLKNSGSTQNDSSLFNNSLFDALFFGQVSGAQRARLVSDLHSAYQVNFSQTKKEGINGRRVYSYNVSLNLQKYAVAAHDYAKALGLPNADQINATANSQNAGSLNLAITVDVMSRQVRQLTYVNNGSSETYSSYGAKTSADLPSHTVSYAVLQTAVEAASK